VAAPYVLAHGIASDASTWDEDNAPGFLSTLDDIGVVYNRFSVAPNGSVVANAQSLATQIGAWLQTVKSDRVHIIAHSKGGLDAQMMAFNHPNFKILSLSTLSTPHLGSVVSDVSTLELMKIQDNINSTQNNSPDPNEYVNKLLNNTWKSVITGLGQQPPGLWDLTTVAATQAKDAKQRGNISPTFSIGASADLDNDHIIDGSEGRLLPLTNSILNSVYQINRNYSSASFLKITGTINTGRTLIFSTTEAKTPQENDIFVTETSANPSWATPLGNVMANHSTIKTNSTTQQGTDVRKLIEQTISLGR